MAHVCRGLGTLTGVKLWVPFSRGQGSPKTHVFGGLWARAAVGTGGSGDVGKRGGPGGCGPGCPGSVDTRGWERGAVPVPPVGGGRWGPRRDGYRNGRTGSGSAAEPWYRDHGESWGRRRCRRFCFRFLRGHPGSAGTAPAGLGSPGAGRDPRPRAFPTEGRDAASGGWPERDFPCPCVSRPRVSRVSPAVPRLCSDSAGLVCPPVPILRWRCARVPTVSCPRGPPLCAPSSQCQCPCGALVPVVRLCPQSGSFLIVPCVSIVPMILVSPGPHMAHPRGSCVPLPHDAHVFGVPACPRGISMSPWS